MDSILTFHFRIKNQQEKKQNIHFAVVLNYQADVFQIKIIRPQDTYAPKEKQRARKRERDVQHIIIGAINDGALRT